jgi:hypothetical protein
MGCAIGEQHGKRLRALGWWRLGGARGAAHNSHAGCWGEPAKEPCHSCPAVGRCPAGMQQAPVTHAAGTHACLLAAALCWRRPGRSCQTQRAQSASIHGAGGERTGGPLQAAGFRLLPCFVSQRGAMCSQLCCCCDAAGRLSALSCASRLRHAGPQQGSGDDRPVCQLVPCNAW